MRVGALPLNVSNTLQYGLTWSTEGLINEYAKPCEGVVDSEKRTLAPLADVEEIKIDGLTYEAFNTSGGIGSMIETYAGKVKNINYKSIRHPGHCDKMKFLMQDMKLGEDLDTMVKIMERAIPRINQDVVLIYVSVDGIRKGLKAELHFAQKYPSKRMFGKYFSALQLTTTTSLCVSVDLLLNSKDNPTGFINQESICLQELNLGLEAHITNDNKNVIETLSPATGELLAKVKNQNLDDMQYAITKAAEVAKQWRQVLAPKRGVLVRLIGEELRKNKII